MQIAYCEMTSRFNPFPTFETPADISDLRIAQAEGKRFPRQATGSPRKGTPGCLREAQPEGEIVRLENRIELTLYSPERGA